jgi:hypothetical protein
MTPFEQMQSAADEYNTLLILAHEGVIGSVQTYEEPSISLSFVKPQAFYGDSFERMAKVCYTVKCGNNVSKGDVPVDLDKLFKSGPPVRSATLRAVIDHVKAIVIEKLAHSLTEKAFSRDIEKPLFEAITDRR